MKAVAAAGALALALTLGALGAAPAAAQQDLDALCGGATSPNAECRLAVAAVELIHPRVGTALWGGSPVPGTASTLGMRLGSVPRFSTAGRLTVLPMTLPPLPDRSTDAAGRGLAAALSGQATLGILPGWSPLPTVGGMFSMDIVGRASWLILPRDAGFSDPSVLGLSGGVRFGLLRESFTLPGVSVTAAYGLSTGFAYGDPAGADDGYIDGAVGNWKATASVTRRLGPIRLTGGASYDRYTTNVDLSYAGAPADGLGARSEIDRWSAFGNVSWTLLILHAVLEAGWQDVPVPDGLPAAVSLDPAGWWASAALRLSI